LRYDQLLKPSTRARENFSRLGDRWRLARPEINVGNIYHRQTQASSEESHRGRMRDSFERLAVIDVADV